MNEQSKEELYQGHTPGPWSWAKGREYADGRDFPTVYMGPEASEIGGATMDEADANAALIAAAPALWAEVQRLREANRVLSETPISRRVELGCAGHLIVSSRCRWKRHTQVGNYRISSIGDYYPDRDGKRDTIGAGPDAFFETMVFKTVEAQDADNEGCGCRAVDDWSEIEGERYATAGEAQAGHERYVAKYETHHE